MNSRLQAVRGMNDLLPEAIGDWQRVEAVARGIFADHGYAEIRMPLVERSELFARSIGAATDIVEKEMYAFQDRSGDMLALRPEGTAGCVRAALQHGLLHNQQPRFWYQGPMFRYERPQKGRYRQFQQIGAECFGIPDADIDAELILLTARLWRELGLSGVTLEINTLGTPDDRQVYREQLVAYFGGHRGLLDEDSKRRLEQNPLRILDSKAPEMQALIDEAPRLLDSLGGASRAHFDRLCAILDRAAVSYEINTRLVRGLDYYTHTVFEWVGEHLGAQNALCGGGRYDGLVEQLGGKPLPATGFSIGVERLVDSLRAVGVSAASATPDCFVVSVAAPAGEALVAAEELRDAGLAVICNCDAAGW
jgi:histidyl-tRNA synthetase